MKATASGFTVMVLCSGSKQAGKHSITEAQCFWTAIAVRHMLTTNGQRLLEALLTPLKQRPQNLLLLLSLTFIACLLFFLSYSHIGQATL